MIDWQAQAKKDRIIVALDCDKACAIQKVQQFEGQVKWVKVGMTLFFSEGPEFVAYLKESGLNVFVDLKLYDIPNQVKLAARELMRCGADIITLHASGGLETTCKYVEENRSLFLDRFDSFADTSVVAVSVLTSFDQVGLCQIGIENDLANQVDKLSLLAKEAGVDGMVCSAFEAKDVRQIFGDDALVITPGIRSAGSSVQDQKRVADANFAFEQGASHIVIGRPIMQANDSLAAFEEIAKSVV
ncbi:MAG: orotidine-5'-phosphate decarboxylase [Coriobacteriales bacterium]|nr:orotidine-5'-phosphate decarboxylase [Coriobacteriales bacterium]